MMSMCILNSKDSEFVYPENLKKSRSPILEYSQTCINQGPCNPLTSMRSCPSPEESAHPDDEQKGV